MGNNDPQGTWQKDLQQVHNGNSNGRQQRVGLTPTEGHDAYKRSSARSSRRSRAERTSYLMATGHLDPEETKQLNNNNQKASSNDNFIYKNTDVDSSPLTVLTPVPQQQYHRGRPAGGDQALLEFASTNLFDTHDNIFAHNNFRASTSKSKSLSKKSNKDRGKFRQTYTEVTLPMKTSPAFEYILKDNKRRNRRCCLWLIYSTIVTICFAVIIFCSVQLILRYQGDT